jgi:hypothetical protein
MHDTPEALAAPEVAHEPEPAGSYPWFVRLAAHFPMTVTVYAYQLNRRGRASRLARGLIVLLNLIVYTSAAWLAVLPVEAATRPAAAPLITVFTPHSVTVLTPQVSTGAVIAETATFALVFMITAWAFRFGWQRIRPAGCIPMGWCGELADYLATQPRDRPVVIRRGNHGHSPLADAQEMLYTPVNDWSGTACPAPLETDLIMVPASTERVVVLGPLG